MNTRHNLMIWCAVGWLLTMTTACAAHGQVPTTVTPTQFFAAKVNGNTDLMDFNTYALNRDQLKVTMGQPNSEACETTEVETACTMEWGGVRVQYSDIAADLELLTLTLHDSTAFLEYGGVTIRVGDAIGQLEQIFPGAYQNRGDNCPAPPGYPPCTHAAIINDGGISGMMFKYNPSTLVIEEIRWHRNIL